MNKRGRPAYKPTTGERRLLTRLENTVEDIEDIIALRDELLKALSESPVPTAVIAKAARMAPTTIAKLRQPGHLVRPPIDRFMDMVKHEQDCWVWTGSLNRFGYGEFGLDGKTTRAPRFIYEHLVGPIPKGHDLHHTCYNRKCVNPEHLKPVTKQEHSDLHR